jgi:hypothetical protein
VFDPKRPIREADIRESRRHEITLFSGQHSTAQSIVAVMATLAFQAGRNPVFPKSQLSCYHTD